MAKRKYTGEQIEMMVKDPRSAPRLAAETGWPVRTIQKRRQAAGLGRANPGVYLSVPRRISAAKMALEGDMLPREVAAMYGVTYRTLRRYVLRYKESLANR